MKLSATYKASGPVLTGAGPGIIDKNLVGLESDVADEGVRRVRSRLGSVLKHPTGFYESRVVKTLRSDGADVTDSRVVYGPWLEGVSSRNTRSRFKGYHAFQMVGQQLAGDVDAVTAPGVRQMMTELNGGN